MTKVLWTHDDYHDKWDCECGAAFCFMHDGPRENDYRFCPACGQRIVLVGGESENEGEIAGMVFTQFCKDTLNPPKVLEQEKTCRWCKFVDWGTMQIFLICKLKALKKTPENEHKITLDTKACKQWKPVEYCVFPVKEA